MRRLASACAVLALLALGGCERAIRDMYQQPRYDPDEASTLFADRRATRPPPTGSVPAAEGTLAMTSSGRRGQEATAQWQVANTAAAAPAATSPLLQRGQERYGIYCLPCHGAVGDGDGMIVRRGFPHPPSLHEERLRAAPDRHLFDVIAQGWGVMPAYGDRVGPEDRWAIVSYVRALQLSQHAELAQLPPALRGRFAASPPTGAASAAGGIKR